MTDNNLEPREELHPAYEAINWNNVPAFEKTIWEKLTSNFWLDTKISLSNDLPTWKTLSDKEKLLVLRVFTGLTMLDTIQGRFGAPALARDATSMFEEAIFANIGFMENVHAKSYSSIFSTLSNTKDINESFRWSTENKWLRKKEEIIMGFYRENDDKFAPLKRKVASVFLESFLFYSGFYLPLYLESQAKLTNTADIIKLIIRDEGVHGYYIGSKFQDAYKQLNAEDAEELSDWIYEFLMELYDNEVRYTQDLYDEHGLTEEVKKFLRFNANRALQNLGLDAAFADEEIDPSIKTQLIGAGTGIFDFFSSSGSNYSVSVKEEISDDDFDF
jgi:ribonucleoside-diphosphate reductase beta chain